MNYFKYNYRGKTMNSISTRQNGNCLSSCKGTAEFEYDYSDAQISVIKEDGKDLSIPETKEAVTKLVKNFIEEFGLNVEWSHEKNTFKFKTREDVKSKLWDVYACVIVSRWFVSGDYNYNLLVSEIHNLHKKGYSVFESYIIATSVYGYSYYSFSGIGILDIDVYRELVKKGEQKKLFEAGGNYSLNNTISSILKFRACPPYLKERDGTVEEFYFKGKDKYKSDDKGFVKIKEDFQNLMKWNENFGKTFKGIRYMHELDDENSQANLFSITLAIKNNELDGRHKFCIKDIGQMGVLDYFKYVEVDEYLTDIKGDIVKNLNIAGTSLYRRKFAKLLESIFTGKGMNLVEEINKVGILEKQLIPWK